MDRFDAIVVGAGPAGCATAYKLARAGLNVVVIERGPYAGSKNLSGGVLYGRVLHDLIPNYWEEAPVERYITTQILTIMTGQASFSANFKSQAFCEPPYNGFTVLRAKFDRWLADKAEEAGAAVITGVRVDRLIRENGRITGVVAGDETLEADVVIAADGANSFLAKEAGLRGPLPNAHLAVGVKELIGLPRQVIEERFQLSGDEGAAYALVGYATRSVGGGAFLYTNRETISVGIVMRLDDLLRERVKPSEVIEDLLAHPMLAPLVRGGELLEYGAHLVPEGGLQMLPRLVADGMLVVGDAAGLTINSGLVVRGMDLAIASGIAAADAVIVAHKAGNFTAQALGSYKRNLEAGFVMKDLKTYANAPVFMETKRIYTTYPDLVASLFGDLYNLDSTPRAKLLPAALKAARKNKVSMWDLARDGLKGLRSL